MMSLEEFLQGLCCLRALGIPDNHFPLPDAVLVGDRSSGKRAMLSSIAKLRIDPKLHCPIRINTRFSQSPSYTIRLHQLFTFGPGRDDNTLGDWKQQEPTTEVFATG
jgi:hypothetical protein